MMRWAWCLALPGVFGLLNKVVTKKDKATFAVLRKGVLLQHASSKVMTKGLSSRPKANIVRTRPTATLPKATFNRSAHHVSQTFNRSDYDVAQNARYGIVLSAGTTSAGRRSSRSC